MTAAALDANLAAVSYVCRTVREHADLLLKHGNINAGIADCLRAHSYDIRRRLRADLRELAQRRQSMAAIERAQTERLEARP